MASYLGVTEVPSAPKEHFEGGMQSDLHGLLVSTCMVVLGRRELTAVSQGNSLGLYLPRISVDPSSRKCSLRACEANGAGQAERAVNTHSLLIAGADRAENQATPVSWGVGQVGAGLNLDIAYLAARDWGEGETLQIPEVADTESLLGLCQGLSRAYYLSTPYLLKNLHFKPAAQAFYALLECCAASPVGAL